MSLPVSTAAAPPSAKLILWLVAVGFFMQTLDTTIVNTALPSMAASLGQHPLQMQSVVIAYALTMAMAIPASGWLADRHGTRRMFTLAILLFVSGSIACALSARFEQLVAARVLQGLGGALLLPVGRLAVLRTFPRERFLHAMSFVAIPGLVGPLIGPTLGGWLVEVASWHWIFLINVPVGVLGMVLSQRYMPEGPRLRSARFDVAGFVLLSAAMVLLSLALDGLAGFGPGVGQVPALLILGLASLAGYALHARRHPRPLFPPRLFATDNFRIGLLGNLFARIGSGAMPFLIPLLLQLGMGFSPMHAGMMMLPVAFAAILSKRAVAPLVQRFGYRRALVGNTLMLGTLVMLFAQVAPGQPWWLHLPLLLGFGAVNSLQFTMMNTVTLMDLDTAEASAGNSMLSMVQMLAMSLGVSVAGALLGVFAQPAAAAAGAPALAAFRATFALVGMATMVSAFVFWRLGAPAGGDAVAPGELE